MNSKVPPEIYNVEGLTPIPLNEKCPVCGDELFKVIVYGGAEIPFLCSCKREKEKKEQDRRKAEEEQAKKLSENERVKQLRKASNYPEKQKTKTLENFVLIKGTETAFNAAQRFIGKVPNVRKGILFIGACGSGKTHLAAAIGNSVLDKGYSVKFITAYDLYEQIMDTYTGFEKSEHDVTNQLKTCYLLIIDDIGTTPPTKRAKAVLHSIIDSRMNREKPTILTTNLTMKELAEELDSRTIDRIPEGFVTFTITASSYRKKKG